MRIECWEDLLGQRRRRWEEKIKLNLRETDCEDEELDVTSSRRSDFGFRGVENSGSTITM